jgi:hypothetical protein
MIYSFRYTKGNKKKHLNKLSYLKISNGSIGFKAIKRMFI